MEPPFFIIGNPRSGTTLFRLMLASHPDLLVTPECGFALWLREAFIDSDFDDTKVRIRFAEKVVQCKKFDTWGVDLETLKAHMLSCENQKRGYAEMVEEVYHCYGKVVAGKSYCRWGDKNNFYLSRIEELLGLFPQAQFIHIIRDGRDVACSYKELHDKNLSGRFSPHLPFEVGDIAREWRENILKIRSSFQLLEPRQKMEVRFEDLLRASDDVLGKVCDFLSVDYSPKMLEYHLLNAEHALEPRELLPWKLKTLEKPQLDRVGRFRKDLTETEILRFEELAGDIIALYAFPYTP